MRKAYYGDPAEEERIPIDPKSEEYKRLRKGMTPAEKLPEKNDRIEAEELRKFREECRKKARPLTEEEKNATLVI